MKERVKKFYEDHTEGFEIALGLLILTTSTAAAYKLGGHVGEGEKAKVGLKAYYAGYGDGLAYQTNMLMKK